MTQYILSGRAREGKLRLPAKAIQDDFCSIFIYNHALPRG